MFVPLVVLNLILLIDSIDTSALERSVKQLRDKHPSHCNAGDENCSNDRMERDATLAIIDYGNEHAVCDVDHHPHICDVVDSLDGIKENMKKSLRMDELVGKDWPFEAYERPSQRKYQSSLGNNKNNGAEMVPKSNLPNPEGGFICAENGFFPDYNDQKMFYHCAASSEGSSGFMVQHKKCPSGLRFNGLNNKCDGSQFKANGNVQATYSFNKRKPEFKEFFHCSRAGLYPDKYNSSMFWYCERNRKNGFTVTKMQCPDDETFDPVKKSCLLIDEPRNLSK